MEKKKEVMKTKFLTIHKDKAQYCIAIKHLLMSNLSLLIYLIKTLFWGHHYQQLVLTEILL